jgi:hypothetical protein
MHVFVLSKFCKDNKSTAGSIGVDLLNALGKPPTQASQ